MKIVKCIDNEAVEDEHEQISNHIQTCPACKEFHRRTIKVKEIFSSIGEPKVTLDIRQELIGKVQADIPRSLMQSQSSEGEERWIRRFFRWRWTMRSAAALFVVASLVTACTLLARSNLALKRDLQRACYEVEVLQQREQVMYTRDDQQDAISDLHVRVKELEGRMPLGISPRTVWRSESPYYRPERPGKL